MELHDPAAAARTFARGAEISQAHTFMKVLAAAMAQHAGERDMAAMLWRTTYETTEDAMIKQNALKHLRAIKVDDDVSKIEQLVDAFKARTGHAPQSIIDLVQAGLLRGIPIDPVGHPYKIVDGRVEVADPNALPFITKGLPPNMHPEFLQLDRSDKR